MSNEWIDIYDDTFHHIGVSSRALAHRFGFWHYTFHCWVLVPMNNTFYVLVQKRHSKKETHPNKWSVSAAGHILAGESPLDGLREVKEEIGLDIQKEELHPMGSFQAVMKKPNFYNREMSLIYYTTQSVSLSDLELERNELSGVALIERFDFYDLFHDKVSSVNGTGFSIDSAGNRTYSSSYSFSKNSFEEEGLPYYRYVSSEFLKHKILVGS